MAATLLLLHLFQQVCKRELLTSFGLSYDKEPNSEPVIMCPQIRHSCCQLSEHYLLLRDLQFVREKEKQLNVDSILTRLKKAL